MLALRVQDYDCVAKYCEDGFCCFKIHCLGLEAGLILFLVSIPNAPMIVAGVFFSRTVLHRVWGAGSL